MDIIAHSRDGKKKRLSTKTIRDNLNPVWNETIEFESMALSSFTVQVWDDDSDIPRRHGWLSQLHSYNITHFTPTVEESFKGRRGTVSFSYSYYQDQGPDLECPCLNGGSCVHDRIAICTCPEKFSGNICEHPTVTATTGDTPN